MAGKSTFLRQNALIAVLAQMGSFVPAEAAHIGIVDRLFSRVGAADDLARGRSTFMVEMVETAAILNQAGPRALVILDEIGRGTATYDGLSIAWATVEHLHDRNRCRALFATHYHELTALASKLDRLACYTMRVKEWQGDVVFLHEVAPGAADRSYGIHVAKLAGLPRPGDCPRRAGAGELGERRASGALTRLAEDLPLFSASKPQAPPEMPEPSPLDPLLAGLARTSCRRARRSNCFTGSRRSATLSSHSASSLFARLLLVLRLPLNVFAGLVPAIHVFDPSHGPAEQVRGRRITERGAVGRGGLIFSAGSPFLLGKPAYLLNPLKVRVNF